MSAERIIKKFQEDTSIYDWVRKPEVMALCKFEVNTDTREWANGSGISMSLQRRVYDGGIEVDLGRHSESEVKFENLRLSEDFFELSDERKAVGLALALHGLDSEGTYLHIDVEYPGDPKYGEAIKHVKAFVGNDPDNFYSKLLNQFQESLVLA